MKKLFTLLFLSVFALHLSAQIDVTIGTGTVQNSNTTYPSPYGNFYWGARHQFMIPATELIAAGMPSNTINGLSFDVVTPQGTALTNFEIKMGHTAQTNLATFEAGLTSVYSVPTYTEVAGWNSHPFASPFVWNGTDNVIVEVCFNNAAFTNNAVVNQSATSYTSSLWLRQDAAGVCANTATTAASNQRPNIRFSDFNPIGNQ